jgi:hypothetical protein
MTDDEYLEYQLPHEQKAQTPPDADHTNLKRLRTAPLPDPMGGIPGPWGYVPDED